MSRDNVVEVWIILADGMKFRAPGPKCYNVSGMRDGKLARHWAISEARKNIKPSLFPVSMTAIVAVSRRAS